MILLKDQIAIVTGGGRGIGAATAKLLACTGVRVIVASRTSEEIEKVSGAINSQFGTGSATPITTDISKPEDCRRLVRAAIDQVGIPTLLINNTGTCPVGNFLSLTTAQWQLAWDTNVMGPMHLSREVLPLMKKAGGGAIVNVSSLAGLAGTEKFRGMSAYTTSKFGIVGLTEALATEAKEMGVRVNCVAPGAVETRMLRDVAPFLKTSTGPEDIARVILFLCDPAQSGKMSGTTIPVYSNE